MTVFNNDKMVSAGFVAWIDLSAEDAVRLVDLLSQSADGFHAGTPVAVVGQTAASRRVYLSEPATRRLVLNVLSKSAAQTQQES